MSGAYIFCTLANNQLYTNYDPAPQGGMSPERFQCLIRGGAGVIDSHTLMTPQGAVTAVTDEQLAELEQNSDFRLHKERGYIVVRARSADVNKVAEDMNKADKSRPYTPSSKEMNEPEYIEAS